MWLLPILIIVFTTVIAVPMSRYMASIFAGHYRLPRILRWFEARIDTGPQNWKQYTVSLLVFNTVLFVFSYLVLFVQPWMPLNQLGRGMLSPSTIFHSATSFITNTNLQHYSGDQHFSIFSQIFFCIANFFLSAAVGLSAIGDYSRVAWRLAFGQLFRRYVANDDVCVFACRFRIVAGIPAAGQSDDVCQRTPSGNS